MHGKSRKNIGTDAAETLIRALDISKGDVISFVGAGGKTSLIKGIAWLLRDHFTVAITTTTHMYPLKYPFWNSYAVLSGVKISLDEAWREGEIAAVFSSLDAEGKCLPLDDPTFAELASRVDVLLVEADGARGKSLKLPRENEPVIHPLSIKAVWVVGLDILDAPIDGEKVFHPEMFGHFGFSPGETVTIENLRKILYAENGYLEKLRGMEIHLCLNKADSLPPSKIGDLHKLFHDEIAGILVSSSKGRKGEVFSIKPLDNSNLGVFGVLLCAGASERFGSNKLLADYNGKPLFMHALDAALASELKKVFVVFDEGNREIGRTIGFLNNNRIIPIEIPGNDSPMSNSLKSGINGLESESYPSGPKAVMVLLGDMPNVSTDLINEVIYGFTSSAASVAAPYFKGKRGHPVVFHPDLFPELLEIEGDEGGRAVANKYAHLTKKIESYDYQSQTDIDVPSDMERGNAVHN